MPIPYEFIVKKRARFLKALNINPEEYENCLGIAEEFNLRNEIIDKFVLKLSDRAYKELNKKENNPNYTPKKLSASWTFMAALRREISEKPKDIEILKGALHRVRKLYEDYNLQK